MNPERWRQVKELFEAAQQRAPSERTQFIAETCRGDESLRREVASLLGYVDDAESYMEQPAAGKVTEVISGTRANLASGTQLSHYEILRPLGAGGMGEVYLAQDTKLHRRVALKLLPANLAADKEAGQRFLREARAAAALEHPNICAIHEISEDAGRNFIVMQYVEGETLADVLRQGRLKLDAALDLVIQIADALAEAHAHNIIHRDIKPANVIVTPRGQAKVLDFGLAKFVEETPETDGEAETATLLSTPGLVMGTVPYMSPEQARGEKLDARTDVFSLGVLLYEMLSGQQPFLRKSMAETISAILTHEPPLAETLLEVPDELLRITRSCLSKDRDARYSTAKDLFAELQQFKERQESSGGLERTAIVHPSASKAGQVEPKASLAVLPFANVSTDAENEYFCDGLAEELLNALAKIDDLKVAARTSAFSFKGKNASASEIGRVLGVRSILEGSVRKSGNRLRITVQLVNAADGYQLWSERYDHELRDIFDVQDEITLAVVDALKLKLLGAEKAAVLKRYTDNAEAYLLYLKGMYYRWKIVPEEFCKSRDYFQRAIDTDPSFALGYFGLSSYYGYGTAWGLLPLPPSEGWSKAEAALAKVMELDDTLPEVKLSLAAFRLVNYRDWDVAGKGIEQATSLNPKFPEIHHLYAFYLLARGHFDEAITEGKRALELDPLSLNYSRFLGLCFHFARRSDEAIGQFKQALELDPNNASIHESLGEALAQQELFGEAVAEWQRALTLDGDDELAAILNSAYAKANFADAVRAVARKRIERMRARAARGEYVPAIGYARAYVSLGDEEQALHWLEQAVEERNVFPLLLSSDPFYDSLRADPRFQELLRRIGLPRS